MLMVVFTITVMLAIVLVLDMCVYCIEFDVGWYNFICGLSV